LSFEVAPGSTEIGFAIDVLGLTTAEGQFRSFAGNLVLDFEHPEQCSVAVRIDSASVEMGWDLAESMVLGEAYLDVETYPDIRFVSRVVTPIGKDHVRMEGMLTMRGISHWESFDAELLARQWDEDRKAERTEFAAIGSVKRSAYQMDGGQSFLDDRVTFTIHTHLLISPVRAP
jgi:polyisoprenoid-binding protein YceI